MTCATMRLVYVLKYNIETILGLTVNITVAKANVII